MNYNSSNNNTFFKRFDGEWIAYQSNLKCYDIIGLAMSYNMENKYKHFTLYIWAFFLYFFRELFCERRSIQSRYGYDNQALLNTFMFQVVWRLVVTGKQVQPKNKKNIYDIHISPYFLSDLKSYIRPTCHKAIYL